MQSGLLEVRYSHKDTVIGWHAQKESIIWWDHYNCYRQRLSVNGSQPYAYATKILQRAINVPTRGSKLCLYGRAGDPNQSEHSISGELDQWSLLNCSAMSSKSDCGVTRPGCSGARCEVGRTVRTSRDWSSESQLEQREHQGGGRLQPGGHKPFRAISLNTLLKVSSLWSNRELN